MRRLLILAVVAACAESPDDENGRVCEAAAEHVEACIPGYVAERNLSCGDYEAERSKWVLTLDCGQVLANAADGKADGVNALKGIRVRKEGNRTYFLIPLAQTFGGDRKALLDETIKKFNARMGELNQKMIAHGVDLGGLLTGPLAQEFAANYTSTIEALLGSDLDRELEVELGHSYGAPKELSTWDRYVMPQAFISYISTKFEVNIGIGAGVSATAMIVIQPWLSIAVDHTLAQPAIVGKSYELDVAMLGVPNVDIGVGAGGGLPLRLGVGAVFGPINRPNDLAGWGLGLSGSFTAPVIGGVHGKFISILKAPPLFMLMLGYSTGTAAEVEVHGNLQRVLDLEAFLAWIDSLT